MSESREWFEVTSREGWRRWLEQNHDTEQGIWAVTYKKNSGGPSVPYEEIVEEALCFGWIDSTRKAVDDERTRLLITPRNPKSKWSRSNKERIARLSKAGLMAPAGKRAVTNAKKSGTWTALDAVERLEEPNELKTGLDSKPKAREAWDHFPPSAKRAILAWIADAKRPETRAKRIEETVERAAKGERANQ